jgi:RHS repeat-associated protein
VEQIGYLAQGQTETDYRPARWNSFRESHRYTGKHDDYEVGLVYYGARYYVPGIGRWASPDPMTIHAMAANSNPYSFVKASPYRYLDPAGFDDEDPDAETETPDRPTAGH